MVHERIYEAAEKNRHAEMTPEQWERQRINFVFGNCGIENPNVTIEVVQAAANRLKERETKRVQERA